MIIKDIPEEDEILKPTKQAIVGYEWNIGGSVRVQIGVGVQDEDGNLLLHSNQQVEYREILGERYKELMREKVDINGNITKPLNCFREEDLWVQIEKLRGLEKLSRELGGNQRG